MSRASASDPVKCRARRNTAWSYWRTSASNATRSPRWAARMSSLSLTRLRAWLTISPDCWEFPLAPLAPTDASKTTDPAGIFARPRNRLCLLLLGRNTPRYVSRGYPILGGLGNGRLGPLLGPLQGGQKAETRALLEGQIPGDP